MLGYRLKKLIGGKRNTEDKGKENLLARKKNI